MAARPPTRSATISTGSTCRPRSSAGGRRGRLTPRRWLRRPGRLPVESVEIADPLNVPLATDRTAAFPISERRALLVGLSDVKGDEMRELGGIAGRKRFHHHEVLGAGAFD